MNFLATYRASFYLMLCCATLVFSIDATDQNRLAMLYPIAVALMGALCFFTVDRNPEHGLSKATANVLGVGTIALTFLEYWYDENLFLLSLAHWLVYLQLIKMYRPKKAEDDWFLFLNGLVQVLVGGVMSQSDAVGMALFSWGLSALWVLGLFTLLRESDRGRPTPGTTVAPSVDPARPYPGLIDGPFVLASLRVAAMTLALGGLIFLVMPRRGTMGTSLKGDSLGKHLTGFDEEVQLGQLGEILENDSIVMTVELFDQDGRRIAAGDDLLWRGVAMARYDRGRWRKLPIKVGTYSLDLPGRPRERRLIRQQIKLEPADNPILFSLRPVLYAEGPVRKYAPEFNIHDGSLYRNDSRPVSLDYVVISSADPAQDQPGENFPSGDRLADYLAISPKLKAQLRPIALEAAAGADPADRREVARRLEHYLRDTGEFGYTLQMDVDNPDLDPVADFLINRKRGHCEYFASALTLLLRSVDVPARLVNGFKGGDWNDLVGVLNVRQKHAHSWTEVLLRDKRSNNDAPPSWVTLDPTPAQARDESVARVGGLAGFRQVSDLIRYIWVFYVVGFNFDRQQKFLYEPIRSLVVEALRGFRMMGQALLVAKDWLFNFPNFGSLISWRGFFVTFGSLLLLAGAGRLAWAVARRILRRLSGPGDDRSALAIGVLFYRRLATMLEAYGLKREPAETPREFARRASQLLSSIDGRGETIADVPPLVVDAYYRIRFGEVQLDPDRLLELEGRLDALESVLKPAPT